MAIDLDALQRELEAAGYPVFEDDGSFRADKYISVGRAIPIIARHVAPQPSPDRAALVDQLATFIVDTEAELNDGNPAPLAARIVAWFVAAGWGPGPEPVTAKEVSQLIREAWVPHYRGDNDLAGAVDAVLTSDVLRSRGITVEGGDVIDLDALKAEIASEVFAQIACDPFYAEFAVRDGTGDRVVNGVLAIIARHVAPVVTPEPDAEAQTDAEIVALVARAIHQRFPLVLKYEAENLASVAVAALTEAGRLVPEGCVALDAGRWERVRAYAEASSLVGMETPDGSILWYSSKPAELRAQLQPGDLDAEPTP